MLETNPIKIYSDRDKIRSEMINLTKLYMDLENLDLEKSDYFAYLINVLSGLSANNLYYNSAMMRDLFLTTAKTRATINLLPTSIKRSVTISDKIL